MLQVSEPATAVLGGAVVTDASIPSKQKVAPTFFADSSGNLKYVVLVVNNPRLMLSAVLSFCLLVTYLLQVSVFAAGNPITEDTHAYDIKHSTSVVYDSYSLASEAMEEERLAFFENVAAFIEEDSDPLAQVYGEVFEALFPGSGAPAKAEQEQVVQGELGDFTYWIYEAKTKEGCFGAEGLRLMEEAEDLFLRDAEWDEYCVKEYLDPLNPSVGTCRKPLSALNFYKASVWDGALAADILARLKAQVPGIPTLPAAGADAGSQTTGKAIYSGLSFCVMYGIGCDALAALGLTAGEQTAAAAFAIALNDDFTAVTDKFDGLGSINANPAEVTDFVAHMKELPSQAFKVDFHFDKDFSVDNQVSHYSRAILFWGAPLVKNGKVLSESASEKHRKKWVMDNKFDKMEKIATKSHNNKVNAYYFMAALILDVFIKILANDGTFALLSIAFVYIYMRFMLKSWFLANIGFLEIVLSIPMAWFTAVSVLQIKYFSSLNPLCLFIVAAIGADDIFVFMDAYKQSAYKGAEITSDLATRMSYVYRRAGTAMMITSLTTCSAFLCCVISPLAMTKSFGIFAALVIWFDYMLVMSMFCTGVVIYHDYFEAPTVNCCLQCACVCCPCGCALCVKPIAEDQTTTALAQKFTKDQEHDLDRITAFYKGPISNFVLNPTSRYTTIAVLGALFAVMVGFATQLRPTEKAEQFLNEDHPLQKAITILNEGFPVASDDRGASHYYIWGVEEVDRTGVNQMFDPDNVGKPVLTKDWEFTPACQEKVVELCAKFQTDTENWGLAKHVKNDDSGLFSVACWPMEMQDWTANGNGPYSSVYGDDCDRGTQSKFNAWPIETDFEEAMARFALSETCWSRAARDGMYMMDAYSVIGERTSSYSVPMGFDGLKLQSVAISIESSVLDPYSEIAEDKARAEYEWFTGLSAKINADMQDACGPVMMTDVDQKYIIMNNQKIFRTSAITGALIGCLIAFVVILISTRNWVVSVLSTVNIVCVLLCVVGFVTMIGWTLSTITAILISILAGFSVDYVVHLAHAFVTTKGDREAKIRGAFADMGVSVFSGMLTSVVASLPLFLCQIQFFASFGTFLCCTIAFSWVYANFFFMGLLASVNSEIGQIGAGHGDGAKSDFATGSVGNDKL